jgi:pimeloyl-ACP methyl ester carboxylesterase
MTQRNRLFIVLCLLLMAGAVYAQDKPKDGYFTTSDGIKIHYIVQGRGTPVILIHGYTGSAQGNWFSNGIAEALAKNHMVVAIDCRNHGKSDKPQPNGPGKAEDVIEMMDHLKLQKAHFHGYSMGGGIVARLMALIPDRFITAGFGGSGVQEVDPEWRAKVPADKQGRDPQEDEASRKLRIRSAMDNGMSREEAEKRADTPRPPRTSTSGAGTATGNPTTPARPAGPQLDLTKITFPVMAVNGEFDRPIAKTHRMWRELRNFTNVILPGKSHLTAIMAGYIPKEYLEGVVKFINANDPPSTGGGSARLKK